MMTAICLAILAYHLSMPWWFWILVALVFIEQS